MRMGTRLALLALVALASGCGRTTPNEPRPPRKTDGGDQPVLDGGPPGACRLVASPTTVDFGTVPIGTSLTGWFEVVNEGDAPCALSKLAIAPGSDPEFSFPDSQHDSYVLPSGAILELLVVFHAESREAPHRKTGSATFQSPDSRGLQGTTTIALAASVVTGCDLHLSPDPLDFGNVPFNTQVTGTLTLKNQGTSQCDVSLVGLAPGTDKLFSLPSGQPASFPVAPGGTASLKAVFDGLDSAEPHLRTGTLKFLVTQPSGEPLNAPWWALVPLLAYVNTECVGRSRWIYTLDESGMLSTFNPTDRSYADIGLLTCPASWGTPFSMAVDQKAVAWVEYSSGELFRVDTATAACSATSFQVDPDLSNFGMGFVFQPTTGVDTLYVAGGPAYGSVPSTLGIISFPSLALTRVATITFGDPELTGTGDGELWGFAPSFISATGVTTLAQIDPRTGAVLKSWEYPSIATSGASWAVKFWGGSFWLFLGASVYEVPRATGVVSTAVDFPGRNIVGAGVSTCAPVQ
jgi:hypothetical protein